MPSLLPTFSLSTGQVAWAIADGQMPDDELLEQMRYLRQLGIPFGKAAVGTGRGHPVRFSYEEMIETAVAIFGLRRGIRPRIMADYLKEQREALRPLYRKAFLDAPEGALDEPWVKSRGRTIPFRPGGISLRMPHRKGEAGKIEMAGPGDLLDLAALGGLVERYPGDETRTLLPLSRRVLELVAWAREAPEFKPGP